MVTMFIQFPQQLDLGFIIYLEVWWAGCCRCACKSRKALAMDTLFARNHRSWGWSMVVLIVNADQNLHFGGLLR